jgi:hypothetical protein
VRSSEQGVISFTMKAESYCSLNGLEIESAGDPLPDGSANVKTNCVEDLTYYSVLLRICGGFTPTPTISPTPRPTFPPTIGPSGMPTTSFYRPGAAMRIRTA